MLAAARVVHVTACQRPAPVRQASCGGSPPAPAGRPEPPACQRPDPARQATCSGGPPPPLSFSRRAAHGGLLLAALAAAAPLPARASLLRFPVTRLGNTYYLVRAGESVAEEEGYVLSNPVAKTSMTSGLSAAGKAQVVRRTAPALRALGACDGGCWIWPALAQNAYQTAEVLGALFGIGRSRIVPEFSFLDMRGVGGLERGPLGAVAEALAQGDGLSPDWRPPQGSDGTPNESVTDVVVRGRQLLSLLETQYQGESVVIVSPDSDNLSALQAAVLGADLRGHRRFGFLAGEARVLQLAATADDDSPVQFACPRPPQCR